MPFAWRGHTKSTTARSGPDPDLAVWLESTQAAGLEPPSTGVEPLDSSLLESLESMQVIAASRQKVRKRARPPLSIPKGESLVTC